MNTAPIRCPLFVPATRPALIPKALASAADAVIVDLEDAVAADRKAEARQALAQFLDATTDARVYVRINAADSGELEAHLALCERYSSAAGIVAPKAEDRVDLERVAALDFAAAAGLTPHSRSTARWSTRGRAGFWRQIINPAPKYLTASGISWALRDQARHMSVPDLARLSRPLAAAAPRY